MQKRTKYSAIYWCVVLVCVIALHLFLVQRYTQFDTFTEDYFPQTDEILYGIRVDGETLYINPQNNFYFYNNFPAADYTVEIIYNLADQEASSEGVMLHIVNASDYDAAAGQYKTLASVLLSASETTQSVSVSLDEYSHDIKMLIDDNEDDLFIIEQVSITSDDFVYTDRYVKAIFFDLCVLAFALGVYLIYRKNAGNCKERRAQLLVFLTLCAIMIMGVYPFIFQDSIIAWGHDYRFHFVRTQSIAQDILAGNFPARITITANRGYGSISGLFYPELFLYFPAVLICLGTNVHTALVLFIIAVSIASVWIAYWSFYNISKTRLVALATTAMFVLCSYKLCNYYTRSALGEYLFMSFLPLMLYAVYHIFREGGKRWWILTIAATCILQSHILGTLLTALVFGGMIVCLLIAQGLQKKAIKQPLLQLFYAAGWTVLLNLWFLVPFLTSYLSGEFEMFDMQYDFYQLFAVMTVPITTVFQLLPVYMHSSLNYTVGGPITLALLVVVGVMITARIRKKPMLDQNRTAAPAFLVSFFIISAISLVIMCAGDLTLWLAEHSSLLFSFFATIQFGFRFFGILTAMICFAFLFVAPDISCKKLQGAICVLLILFAGVNAYLVIDYDYLLYYEDEPNQLVHSYYAEEYRRVDTASYWSQWTTYSADPVFPEDEVSILSYDKDGFTVVLSYENISETAHYIELPLYFYYGYQAIGADGLSYNLVIGDGGLLRIIIPANSTDEITVTFQQRTLYQLFDFATLCMAMVFCAFVLPTKYQLHWRGLLRWALRRFGKKELQQSC